jgi:hypothetical protein
MALRRRISLKLVYWVPASIENVAYLFGFAVDLLAESDEVTLS